MSDERAQRQELEDLQHEAKALRAELAAPSAPKFLETREALQRQLLEETPAVVREEKLAAAEVARETELKSAIDVARMALAAAEQRKLSPALLLAPLLSFCLLSSWAGQGDTVLANRTFAWAVATLSAALLGFIVGRKLWAPPGVPQAPLPARAWSAVSTHGLRNPSAWGLAPFAAGMVLLIIAGASLSPHRITTFIDLGWCQLAALVAFAFGLRGLSSAESSHQGLGRIEATISAMVLVVAAILGGRAVTNQWFDSGGLLVKLTLGAVLAAPLLASATWFWLEKRQGRRPAALWVVPGVLSMVASVALLVSTRPDEVDELQVPEQVMTAVAADEPRVPAFLVLEEAEAVHSAWLVGQSEVGDRSREAWLELQRNRSAVARTLAARRSADVSSFLFAVQFALISALGAWFFSAAATGRRRWLARALPLVPVLVLLAAVLLRS